MKPYINIHTIAGARIWCIADDTWCVIRYWVSEKRSPSECALFIGEYSILFEEGEKRQGKNTS
jgi:hypothetical protein